MTLSPNTQKALVVLTTCPNQEEADRIARYLVSNRIAACVNVLGGGGVSASSYYLWEGTLQVEQEVLLIIKTEQPFLKRLETTIRELHSYTVPEILVLPIESGCDDYLGWISQSLG